MAARIVRGVLHNSSFVVSDDATSEFYERIFNDRKTGRITFYLIKICVCVFFLHEIINRTIKKIH